MKQTIGWISFVGIASIVVMAGCGDNSGRRATPPPMDATATPDASPDSGTPDAMTMPNPGEVGGRCARNADCTTGLCLEIGRCTEECTDSRMCPNGWECDALAGAGLVCLCEPNAPEELCNGVDDNCDGIVDVGASCEPGLVCDGGSCRCPPAERCNDECVDRMTDARHCGTCGNACPGGQACEAGACVLNCSGDATRCGNSCVDTGSDASHCGGCNNACGAGGVCTDGACACTLGLEPCSGGCADFQTDRQNCGACGRRCNAVEVCSAGSCECGMGTTRCGSDCVDTQTDSANCGSCGNACPMGQVCELGTCQVACRPTEIRCGGACADVQTDPMNCGACGTVCPAGQLCQMGSCRVDCGALMMCGMACADTTIDPLNCGACGVTCSVDQVCTGGSCRCGTGQMLCGGSCVDVSRDAFNCGTCGNTCPAGSSCRFGGCTVPVGASCASDVDCVSTSGGICATTAEGWPGGYCYSDCAISSCPSGASCVDIGGAFACLDACVFPSDCRSGYVCEPLTGGGSVCLPPA
ncbi:MAG: MXAN_6577-like cysteine-rich protein [Myxococcota bacterium]